MPSVPNSQTSQTSKTSQKSQKSQTSEARKANQAENIDSMSSPSDQNKNLIEKNLEQTVVQIDPEIVMKETPEDYTVEIKSKAEYNDVIEKQKLEKDEGPERKKVGIIGGLAIHIGVIVGSGIFITVQNTLLPYSQSLGCLIFMWIFCGIISLIGGLCYVQLGIMMPVSGGERNYLAKAFMTQFGTVFAYGYSFIVKTITLAAISQTFGKYMTQMIRGGGDYIYNKQFDQIFAILCLMIVCVLNILSKTLANRTQIFFTVLKILAIIIIILIGMVLIIKGDGFQDPNPFDHWWDVDKFMPSLLVDAVVNCLWAYEGWNTLGAVVGEMKNPRRDLPIANILGTIVIVLLYCLTIISYVGMLGYKAVAETETVAALFASKAIKKAQQVIPFFICLSTIGACHGTLLTVSRILMNSAMKKDVPQVFGLVHKKQRTPVIALFSITVFSVVFTAFTLKQLVIYCAVITWTFYAMTMAALIKLNYKHPEVDHSFKLPTVFPVIIIVFSTFIVGSLIYTNTLSLIFMTVLAVIFGIHFLPERYLKPRSVLNFGTAVENIFSKLYNLELADDRDVS